MKLQSLYLMNLIKASSNYSHELDDVRGQELQSRGVHPKIRDFSNGYLNHSGIVSPNYFLTQLKLHDLFPFFLKANLIGLGLAEEGIDILNIFRVNIFIIAFQDINVALLSFDMGSLS